jgi:hypothetical protein
VQPEAIRERVKALEDEIAKLRVTYEEYLSHPIHSSAAQGPERNENSGCNKFLMNSPSSRNTKFHRAVLCKYSITN